MQRSKPSEPQGRRRVVLLWALAVVLSLVVVAFAIWVLPLVLTRHPSAGLTAAARLKAENDARTPVLAALAVVGAAALTARYTWRATKSSQAGQQIDRDRQEIDRQRQETDRQAQITDRYTKAIDQLGSDKVDVRIGGIYALERLALDSERDHPIVMEVLTAFVREHAREPLPQSAPGTQAVRGPAPEHAIRPDIQAALTVIGHRNVSYDKGRIDLAGAYLARADLTRRDGRADFAGADLTGADLTGADLTGAFLTGAFLTGANLDGADLTRADLTSTNLSRADLTGANLSHANLTSAYLMGADLSGAYLSDADLIGVNRTGADISTAYLTGARYLEGAPVPEGWVLDPASGRLERASEEPRDAP